MAKHGVQGVGEIIAFTKGKFAKMDKKGEGYDAANYLAKMLNEGVGVKAPEVRKREAEAKKTLAQRAAAKAKKEAAERAEKELEKRFSYFKAARAQELLDGCSADDLDKLHERVAEALPAYADFRRRWQDVGRDYRNLDRRKATDGLLFRGYVVPEALSLWGKPEDTDLARIIHQAA